MRDRTFSFDRAAGVVVALVCLTWQAPAGRLLAAGADDRVETGAFTLFKFEQPIGEERYQIHTSADGDRLDSSFNFTDRGTAVPLTTLLELDATHAPVRFSLQGQTARISAIDLEVNVRGGTAIVREREATTSQPMPPGAFTMAGYAPPSMQMELMRFWASRGRPTSIPLLPRGTARIEPRGRDTIDVNGRPMTLDRYSVTGVVWGREWLWCDESGRLAALTSVDAEFDHFEAARPEIASAIPALVARAAGDGMAAMAEIAATNTPPASPIVAVTNATIVDGTSRPPITNGTIVVVNGRIDAVGPADAVAVPPDATIVRAAGRTVIPGLWDMHAHFEQAEWGPIYLASGVTTIRDVGNELEFIKAVRDAVASGRGLGPRMLLAGIIDGEGPRALGLVRAASPEEGRAAVRRYHDAGFDQIKVYSSMTRDVLRAVAREAHSHGMTVTGHVPAGMDALQAIDAGLDQINHAKYLAPLMKQNAQATVAVLKEHHTVVDPTLALYELLARPFDRPIAAFEPGVLKVAPELSAPLNGFGLPAQEAERQRPQEAETLAVVGALHRAGIPIVAGTDQAVPGYSLHREIELYVDAGFSPLEALQAATIVPARAMKKDGDSGSLEKGKRGDLVVLDANPLDDIHNTRRVYRVITNGRVFDPAPLWRSVGFQP